MLCYSLTGEFTERIMFMPYNVVDRNGNHLGIVYRSFNQIDKEHIYLVAITHQKVEAVTVDRLTIKNEVADMLECRTMFGKINEDKLDRKLDDILENEYKDFGYINKDDFIKLLFLESGLLLKTSVIKDIDIKGYILMDMKETDYDKNQLVIGEIVDYIDEKLPEGYPIYGKIVHYPIIKQDTMGFGEGFLLGADLADYGGRNHIHYTRLIIKSGNYVDSYEIPMQLTVKKGDNIQLYIDKDEIKRVFCNETIYEF